MEKRIIAVNSNCYHGYSMEEAIEGIRRADWQRQRVRHCWGIF